MLRLNTDPKDRWICCRRNSNTTNVKVKHRRKIKMNLQQNNSNTTNVKVKLKEIATAFITELNSNTTNVKVKRVSYKEFEFALPKFKYNQC